MAKNKYYAVKVGRSPGVYSTWDACKEQVDGFSGAVYKSFSTLVEAEVFAGCGGKREIPEEKKDPADSLNKEGNMPDGEGIAYVDGSYNVATGEYGCGMVFMTGDLQLHIAKKGENPELSPMRNVAGEILGAQLAMEKAVELGLRKLSIYHDYQGIASWCLGEWKTNREGTKKYKEYYESVCDQVKITFVKVKGHSGDVYNDLADELAKSAIF